MALKAREKERKCLAKLHRMCGWTKKVLLKGQYSVQCTVLYCITSTEREVFLQKITSFRNLLTEKRKNGPRKASRVEKEAIRVCKTFFKIVSLFFSHFGNDARGAGELASVYW